MRRDCDGSFRSDPHFPRTCTDSTFVAPEVTQDNSAGIGCLTTPRDLSGFKRRLPPLAGERARNRSWEAPKVLDTEEQTTEEDAETRKEEAALGGAERRRNQSRQKPLKTSADPGELCERATTLQENRGLSRYGVRYKGSGQEVRKRARKGKQRGTARGELGGRENKGARHGEHWEEEKRRESEKDKDSEESYICTLTYNINPKSGKGKTGKKGSL
ncbi:hypothetical protein NDU88_003242 [Pleurodeles waltl]|uniref:Uncharacterized protein n=1 Tax=Pleurodeles waltl TaxID=8319 RepID=A0AAV7LI12_PLEWA|nr:hypothetical protein NDU88_003242 [Pleurodeles waltl]